ncbi:MAG: 30S ribosomal protein S6 [Polyangiaceae bacterium]|nr:30S ribosomal protein S6 [Polyangiaceae bacterium]
MAKTTIQHAKEYEIIYVLRGDVDADTADRVQSRVAEVVTREAGKLVKVEAWGRRKLAYPVQKNKKGVYVYVKFVGKGALVAELERNLKLQDSVLKYQTVLLNDNVNLADVAVDPADVKLGRLELAAETDEADSIERTLGLVDAPDHHRSDSRGRDHGGNDDFQDEAAEGGETAEGGEEEASS